MLRHPQIAAKSLPTTSTKLNQSLDGSPVDANCNHRRRATCHVRYSCSLYLYEYYYYYYYYCSLESRCIKAHLSTDGCIYRDGYCDVMTWGGLRLTAVPKVNSALHPFGVAKSSTSFGWGKGGNVASARCDPIWHVSSCSGEPGCLPKANCYTAFTLLTYFIQCEPNVNHRYIETVRTCTRAFLNNSKQ